jgi:hypothetical protein
MKSTVTKVEYIGRLGKFFDFVGLEGDTVEEKSRNYVLQAKKEGNQWVFHNVLRFIQFQLDRVNKKEITGSTVRNYLKRH